MEPFANYYLEKELATFGIEIKRYTNAHYLLFEKKYKMKKYLKYIKGLVKYSMGADSTDNIGRTKYLCEHKYDGIIHIIAQDGAITLSTTAYKSEEDENAIVKLTYDWKKINEDNTFTPGGR